MFKKIVIIFICLIIGVSWFWCGNFTHKTSQKVTIQFSSWGSESEISILKPLLAEFERKNPDIKVDFMHIPQNYFQKLHLLFASNTAPDVVFMNNQYLPTYANADVLEDLTPYYDNLNLDKFYQKSIEAMSYDGKVYAIPRDISNLVIFYNKDIFRKYNVPYPHSGWTYDEFLTTAQKLTHGSEVFGISFEEEPLFYMPYLMSFGIDGIPDYNDKITRNALQNYADLRTKYHVAPLKEDSASATMAQMFLQGHLAMHLSGRWLVPKYRTDAKFDWDVIEFPKGSSGSVVPLDASGWSIAKSSKHKPEALKLIQFLSSQYSSEKFAISGLAVPARIDSANSKYFIDGQKPKNARVFLDIIETSKPTPVKVNYREILDNLKTQTEQIFRG